MKPHPTHHQTFQSPYLMALHTSPSVFTDEQTGAPWGWTTAPKVTVPADWATRTATLDCPWILRLSASHNLVWVTQLFLVTHPRNSTTPWGTVPVPSRQRCLGLKHSRLPQPAQSPYRCALYSPGSPNSPYQNWEGSHCLNYSCTTYQYYEHYLLYVSYNFFQMWLWYTF